MKYKLATIALAATLTLPLASFASSHREAPITALDHKADITDIYAFRSYGGASPTPRVTLILGVDPLLEPGNGPNWFPFDPDILYEIKVDNNHDAVEDVVFQFRFTTEQRLPDLFTVYAGIGLNGAVAPANSPPPVPPGQLIVPPRIMSFGDAGLGLRQSFTLNMVKGGVVTPITKADGGPFYVVPANVGPRTMDYGALFNLGIHATNLPEVKAFALSLIHI